ncbi:11288_t:CDS:2 [Paraglomus brasilianum]|uniref:EKC/KEOPS complex subunit CGI121 n=1 Tax=Paraglomus brasilianum TaxID=144538 RepID=A0A9N8VD17_9GLOM|nr:11288_t:CDS:2 [Paraglomus brasilianum]
MYSSSLEPFPSHGLVHISLYRNVKNAKELRKRLLSRDTELCYAFIDARVILDKFQVLVASNIAIYNETHNKLITHNVHSEVVYSLSPSTNIRESLKNHGLSDDSTDVIIVKIGDSAETVQAHLARIIKGEERDVKEITSCVDLARVKKCYKIVDGISDREELLKAVIGSIAIKNLS